MLLGFQGVLYRIGQQVLLDHADFSIDNGERVALVGRNGVGKSTLFNVLMGHVVPEDGRIIFSDGVRIGTLAQEVPGQHERTIFEIVAQGLGTVGAAVATVWGHSVGLWPQSNDDALFQAQQVLHDANAWHLESTVHQILARLQLPAQALFAGLSGGMKRKVMLACALVGSPDVLLLDEPTNHLDIQGIQILEELLNGYRGALMFVSHDRAFTRRLATRVCDLDRGLLKSWAGGYEAYLKGKAQALEAEAKSVALFDKKLAQEEVWIRRGVEARRTRNEGRVRALMAMRQTFAERRDVLGKANMQVQEAERSGKLVAELHEVSVRVGQVQALQQFSSVVVRGEKIALLGPNGIGKTTALRVLLGQHRPDAGWVRLGSRLEVAYFDQLRTQFNPEESAVEVIGAGREYIGEGKEARHVMGYLQEFLFSPDRARQPVRSLSGGERARLLLAQVFSKPSNVMVLDEPTNDLDLETLELLEEKLMEYTGTLLLVSHDREFINNIATRCWVFEGEGIVREYVGGYDDWLNQRPCDPWSKPAAVPGAVRDGASRANLPLLDQTGSVGNVGNPKAAASAPIAPIAPPSQGSKARKLSYKDQRELEALPARIEGLEAEQKALAERMSQADFYQQDATAIVAAQARVAELEQALAQAYARWEILDGM